MKPYSLLLLFFIILPFSSMILNASDDFTLNTKGGLFIYEIKDNPSPPSVFLNKQELLTISYKGKYYLLYPISYETSLGKNTIAVIINQNLHYLNFQVIPKLFDIQNIVIDKKYISPSNKNLKRINIERSSLKLAKDYWYNLNPDLDFIIPADGIITGRFGTKRFYNGKEGNPHNGLDIAAEKGTLVIAPSAGKVILTGNYYYNGKFILLDHGKGLKSIFIHLDQILVKRGDNINKGDKIGKIGNTGKSAGPHLHWSLMLNKTYIDPEYFLSSKIIDYFSLKVE